RGARRRRDGAAPVHRRIRARHDRRPESADELAAAADLQRRGPGPGPPRPASMGRGPDARGGRSRAHARRPPDPAKEQARPMSPDDPRATPLEAPIPDTTTEMSHAEDRDTEPTPQGGTPMELATSHDRRPPPSEVNAPGITLRAINAYYGDTDAIKGVDLDYAPNQVTAMIGP